MSTKAFPGETPLSDLIAVQAASGQPRDWARFVEAFRTSQLGVMVSGASEYPSGTFVVTEDQPMSVGLTTHAGGRPMVLAFADPAAFERRFGRQFNALMTGDDLLATALANPACAGVLVNSALAEISVVIDRATAESLARAGGGAGAKGKPWWRFW
ncbi:MAG TPA: SseB family protein [Pyrinomonadaceae bacterium]